MTANGMRREWAAIALGVTSVAGAAQVGIEGPGMQSPTGFGHHGTAMP